MVWEATRTLAQVLLITTARDVQARVCYGRLSDKTPVSLIAASPLDAARARSFLETRLALHRKDGAGVHPLAPFSPEALSAMYEGAGTGANGGHVRHPIGQLITRLRFALERHHHALSSGVPETGVVISPEHMRQYMESVNNGEHAV